ncbi:DNA-binding domain-containing protein [Yoonia sp. SS1-5]|uniref:DNA-binding domain-containing protein n=1 Tax=Yoonia rhodophyticola TaxID=3137370 RepID=A0AAN0NKD0_9RHOB
MTVTQSAFRAAVLDPQQPAPTGLQNPDGVPATKRFDVYRNNVAVSLSEALETAFPVIRKLVGDPFFRAMAGVYLRKHPPRSPLMMFYGDAMPQFLGRFPPAKTLPYLPDIARLELAMRHAYHAADATPIAADALGALTPDALMGARLLLAPAVRALSSAHPIHGIYRANTTDDADRPIMQAEAVLITRPGFDPEIHHVTPAAATFITALTDGQSLGQAMTTAGDMLDLGEILGLLLRQNAVIQID